jgi:ParB-like chromosome segregation protein Spo0J
MTAAAEIAGRLRTLKTSELRPNPWNPNQMDEAMFSKEMASIRKFGFVDPVTVRWVTDGYEIIDGENRWRAAERLHMAEIPVWDLGAVPDHLAMQLTIVLNEVRGQAEPRKLADLLRDLLSRESKESLIATLPYSKEAFDQIANIGHMDLSNLTPTKPQRQIAKWVERVYRMPLDAAEEIDSAIAECREINDPDMTEWAALVEICSAYHTR